MDYNAGYDVSYIGYHYDIVCIDFPKSRWKSWLENNKKKTHFYYAYIKDIDTNEFVGHFNFNEENNKYYMGIVVHYKYQGKSYMSSAMMKLFEEAKTQGVKKLFDSVPASQIKTLKVFFDFGFEIGEEFNILKFGKENLCYEIVKDL